MSSRISRGGLVLVWITTILLALIFMNAGIGKFSVNGFWTALFRRWGLPHWFQLVIGMEEVIAALLLLWPKTARLGAALVAATMTGAVVVGLAHGEFKHLQGELIAVLFATVIFVARQRMQASEKQVVPAT